MKIASSNLQMASNHLVSQQYENSETLRAWTTPRRLRPEGEHHDHGRQQDLVSLSDAGKAAQSSEAQSVAESKDATEKDPRIQLIKTVIEYLTGKSVKTLDARDLQTHSQSTAATEASSATQAQASGNTSAGYGIDYQRHESYTEYEKTSFSASGTIKTADGQEISFKLDISMERYYHEESDTHIQMGDAAKATDPLVINFGGTAAQLGNTKFSFDLNSDGHKDQISQLLSGSGYLALDANKDGKINDGKELFGPSTGNGFGELTVLDSDHNGWIDENDKAWDQLQVWTPDASGKGTLQSLKDANVGAIALQHQATPFDIKNSANELLGQVVASGVFLKENGGVGSVQQIDLVA